jgi:hypothetical protein
VRIPKRFYYLAMALGRDLTPFEKETLVTISRLFYVKLSDSVGKDRREDSLDGLDSKQQFDCAFFSVKTKDCVESVRNLNLI